MIDTRSGHRLVFAAMTRFVSDRGVRFCRDPKSAAPVSAGIFPSEGRGEFDAAIKPSRPIALADKFAVSLEPKNEFASPRGPIFLMSN